MKQRVSIGKHLNYGKRDQKRINNRLQLVRLVDDTESEFYALTLLLLCCSVEQLSIELS